MDELEKIKKKLKAAAGSQSEETRLIELFESGSAGLASQTSAGVREEVEKKLDDFTEAISEKAAEIQKLLRE